MIDDDEEFLRELMQTFREDAEERIRLLSQAVVELESAQTQAAALAPLESLYRETHSLKGASGAVEQKQMESVCQHLESVLAALKAGSLKITPPLVDALSETVDCLQALLLAKPEAESHAVELIARLDFLAIPTPSRVATRSARTRAPRAEAGVRMPEPPEELPRPLKPTGHSRLPTTCASPQPNWSR